MRALCASIITAGALIGLGLSSLGVGTRSQNLVARDPAAPPYSHWVPLDPPLLLTRAVLLGAVRAGVADVLWIGGE